MTQIRPAAVKDLVIVLDFGGQYTQLIARRIRECRVYCEILPFDTTLEQILSREPKGIIFSGGPASVYEKDAPRVDPAIYASGVPILGICYGAQLMSHQLGGDVKPARTESTAKRKLRSSTHLSFLSDSISSL